MAEEVERAQAEHEAEQRESNLNLAEQSQFAANDRPDNELGIIEDNDVLSADGAEPSPGSTSLTAGYPLPEYRERDEQAGLDTTLRPLAG
jgi:hypothetical protein